MRAPAVAKYTDFGQLRLRNPAPPAQANSKFFSSKLGEKFTTNLEFQEKFNKSHIVLEDTVGQRSFPKPVLVVLDPDPDLNRFCLDPDTDLYQSSPQKRTKY